MRWVRLGILYSERRLEMSVTQFTPGPWEAKREVYSSSWRIRTVGTQLELAEAYPEDDETPFPVEANARLIAAAPTMHDALTDAAKALAGYHAAFGADDIQEAVLANVNAALAKATSGEER
jgi:hypothetical protein